MAILNHMEATGQEEQKKHHKKSHDHAGCGGTEEGELSFGDVAEMAGHLSTVTVTL